MDDDQIFGSQKIDPRKYFGPNGSYFAFGISKRPDGESYIASIVIEGKEHTLSLRHESIDGYIYALESLKQDLELLRIRNEDSSKL